MAIYGVCPLNMVLSNPSKSEPGNFETVLVRHDGNNILETNIKLCFFVYPQKRTGYKSQMSDIHSVSPFDSANNAEESEATSLVHRKDSFCT